MRSPPCDVSTTAVPAVVAKNRIVPSVVEITIHVDIDVFDIGMRKLNALISGQLHVQIEIFEADSASFFPEQGQRSIGNDVEAVSLDDHASLDVKAAVAGHSDVVHQGVRAVDQLGCHQFT